MYEVIYNTTLKNLLDKVNKAVANGYTPIGGITHVYHKHQFAVDLNNYVDFNDPNYKQNITFMQTLYKPQTKELL